MTSRLNIRFRSAFAACFSIVWAVCGAGPAAAADKAGSKDFPTISRFEGAEIDNYRQSEFDAAELPIAALPTRTPPPGAMQTAEGRITRINYRIPKGKSALEVIRNYEQALGSTFETVFECAGKACGSQFAGVVAGTGRVIPGGFKTSFETAYNRYLLAKKRGPGGDVYALFYAMQNSAGATLLYQQTVEVKAMQTDQVRLIDAAGLKRGLEAEGKVAVYGVLFDTAKADIKPESKASLDEMGKLLKDDRALKVYVVGHTDNVGALAANLDLSQRRAEAVTKALAAGYQVDAKRMEAKGVASLAPVASNAEEAGRARNRRVELVLQ